MSQGLVTRMPKGNNIIFLIPRGKVPNGKTFTYGVIVEEIIPQKAETYRVRITVVGNRLEFYAVTATQCALLVTTKNLFRSTVSTPGAHFCTFDIKYLYYVIPM